jgi:hypothetical protein
MTWVTRAGDSLVKVEALPVGMAIMDIEGMVEPLQSDQIRR